MTEITNITYIVESSKLIVQKDVWDYVGIIGSMTAPIVAIMFSIWNNLQIKKLRKEDHRREEEMHEKAEIKQQFQEINKFIDDQIYFLDNIEDFSNVIVKLQGYFSKCSMITRSATRDRMIYYISAYVEVSYFLLKDLPSKEDCRNAKIFFLNSLKEFDILLINKKLDVAQQRLEFLREELGKICKR